MNGYDQQGLFDIPEGASTVPPDRSARSARGRNRETWTCVVTAEVTITDPDAIWAAFARAEDAAVEITLDGSAEDEDTGSEASDEPVVRDAFDALAWLIWPTDGLEPLLEAGAVQIWSVESAVEAHSGDRGEMSWTVAVKLEDVRELRRIAVQAHPEEATQIEDSLPVAWQCAADPFAPLRTIPGITWQAGRVETEHVPARKRGAEIR